MFYGGGVGRVGFGGIGSGKVYVHVVKFTRGVGNYVHLYKNDWGGGFGLYTGIQNEKS